MKLKGKVLLFGVAILASTYGINKALSEEAGHSNI